MQPELGKLGRTWWTAIALIAASTVLFAMNKIDSAMWQQTVSLAFGLAGLKSTAVGVSQAISNKKG